MSRGPSVSSWQLAIAACSSVASGGCALDDHGFVRVARSATETACVVRLETWGGHISTQPADGGFVIGRASRTYVVPRRDGVSQGVVARPAHATAGGTLAPADGIACGSGGPLDRAVFAYRRDIGVSLDANRNRVGLAVGLRAQGVLVVDAQSDTEVILHFEPDAPGSTRAFIQQR